MIDGRKASEIAAPQAFSSCIRRNLSTPSAGMIGKASDLIAQVGKLAPCGRPGCPTLPTIQHGNGQNPKSRR
jgi:hypothetical protein